MFLGTPASSIRHAGHVKEAAACRGAGTGADLGFPRKSGQVIYAASPIAAAVEAEPVDVATAADDPEPVPSPLRSPPGPLTA